MDSVAILQQKNKKTRSTYITHNSFREARFWLQGRSAMNQSATYLQGEYPDGGNLVVEAPPVIPHQLVLRDATKRARPTKQVQLTSLVILIHVVDTSSAEKKINASL